jgi:hypothetical protein
MDWEKTLDGLKQGQAKDLEIKDKVSALEEMIKNGCPERKERYARLIGALEASDLSYEDAFSVLDWLNAQVILGVCKGIDKGHSFRLAEILKGATQKLLNKMIAEGGLK